VTAYYNENDPYAAQWLRNLIREGLIAPGDVDDRSIRAVHPIDLIGYTQCHFFAGIGVWIYALRLAGWPDDRPVWTGSCPCQPFSAAGKRGGITDERHLWPEFFRLIQPHRPVTIFGEQVASKDGLAWLDIVHADLESANYACGAVDLCAAGIGAPHIRQRLWFVAYPNGGDARAEGLQRSGEHGLVAQDGGPDRLEHPSRDGRIERRAEPSRRGAASGCGESLLEHAASEQMGFPGYSWERRSSDSVLGNSNDEGPQGRRLLGTTGCRDGANQCAVGPTGPTNGFWRDADWLPCRDGKARPVEPGTFPLAHGITNRVGRLRAYGNAINAEAAKEFIAAAILHLP
jgi:DNA (cytosine-5)-methyltransferase 1